MQTTNNPDRVVALSLILSFEAWEAGLDCLARTYPANADFVGSGSGSVLCEPCLSRGVDMGHVDRLHVGTGQEIGCWLSL
jgi:hypothetical protein